MKNSIVKFWSLFCHACKSSCSNWKEASAWQKFLRNEILFSLVIQGSHRLEKFLNFRGSPWMPFFPEKSQNFSASPWKIKLREVKVIYMKCFFFYAIINYQFKTSEPKNVEKFLGAKSSRLKVLSEWTRNVHFCTMCDITFLVGGPWKVLKNGFNFLYEPCHNLVFCKHSCKVVVTMYIVLV